MNKRFILSLALGATAWLGVAIAQEQAEDSKPETAEEAAPTPTPREAQKKDTARKEGAKKDDAAEAPKEDVDGEDEADFDAGVSAAAAETAVEEGAPPADAKTILNETEKDAEIAAENEPSPESELEEPVDPVPTPKPLSETEVTEAEVGAEEMAREETEAAAGEIDFLPEPTAEDLGAPLDADLPTEGMTAEDIPNPDDLIPDDVYTGDDMPPPPPTVVESKAEKERKLRVRYQEVKLQALKDPAVRQMREKADIAKTDEAKRQALREYYRLLFEKMVSIDGNLADKCRAMEQAYLRRVGQYRIAPTIPLQPPPTPEPLELTSSDQPASNESDD